MNRKPPELHLVEGTTSRTGNTVMLPESIRKRIPEAPWMENPDAWDRKEFVRSTSEFLFTVYGIGNEQDQHTLAMLANQIDLYIKCCKGINKNGIVTTYNDGKTIGPNPYIAVSQKTLTLCIQLMNELGLTPKSRLAAGKIEDNSIASKFTRSPFAK